MEKTLRVMLYSLSFIILLAMLAGVLGGLDSFLRVLKFAIVVSVTCLVSFSIIWLSGMSEKNVLFKILFYAVFIGSIILGLVMTFDK
jgi:hypothetical protein